MLRNFVGLALCSHFVASAAFSSSPLPSHPSLRATVMPRAASSVSNVAVGGRIERNGNLLGSTVSLAAQGGNEGDDKISVAVIGGGVAGLSCAKNLAGTENFKATVFDTGRLRPGGRCSSRLPGDKPKNANASRDKILGNLVIDHAAQILAVPKVDGFEKFAEQVKRWEDEGIIQKFPPGSVCEILQDKKAKEPSKEFYLRPINSKKSGMYYGVNGMGSIPAALATPEEGEDAFQIQQDVWVSPNNGVKFMGGPFEPQWKVTCNGRSLGTFDRLVIAHNGKCADRLMSRTPAKALHSLLRTNFAPTVPQWGGKRMTLNSIYSFTFAIKKDGSPLANALGEDVICAFVKNHPNLRLLTCQTRKHRGPNAATDRAEVWTILSSPKFAKKYKAPQENIPVETAEQVMDLLLQSVEESLNLKSGVLDKEGILDSKLQLWGAAVPLNVWESSDEAGEGTDGVAASGFLYDPENGVGAAGDWLLDPSIGGAWESGRRLADWMMAAEANKEQQKVSVGLPPNGAFHVSRAASQAGIGNVR